MKVLSDSSEYMPVPFLTADFFANIDRYSAVVSDSDIVIVDLENIYDDFDSAISLKILTSLNSDLIIITAASVANRR